MRGPGVTLCPRQVDAARILAKLVLAGKADSSQGFALAMRVFDELLQGDEGAGFYAFRIDHPEVHRQSALLGGPGPWISGPPEIHQWPDHGRNQPPSDWPQAGEPDRDPYSGQVYGDEL